jgi:hypothetical protein
VTIDFDYRNESCASRRWLWGRASQSLLMQLDPLAQQVGVDPMLECEPGDRSTRLKTRFHQLLFGLPVISALTVPTNVDDLQARHF